MIMIINIVIFYFFFFNDTATTEIYTLSLHDALPISDKIFDADEEINLKFNTAREIVRLLERYNLSDTSEDIKRSEEHTSELQSRQYLVCRLLLEKKKKTS